MIVWLRNYDWKVLVQNLIDIGIKAGVGEDEIIASDLQNKSHPESGVVALARSSDDQVSSFGHQKWSTQKNFGRVLRRRMRA